MCRRPELGDDVQLRRRGDGRARLDRRNRRHLGTPLLHGTTSLAVLYAAQLLGVSLRRRGRIGSTLDNDPLLVFIDGDVPRGGLRAGHIVEAEVWSAVRRAGVSSVACDHAVVSETTGELPVLHGAAGETIHERIDAARSATSR